MSHNYFDHNQHLQIHGDVMFVSGAGTTEDDHSFFTVRQRMQSESDRSRAVERGFKILCDNTAPLARYGSGHSFIGPQCHPGTRVTVQDYVFKWLNDPAGPIAMWMNGPVGIGKSAIAQTVTHLAAKREQLSSAFFFFRSDDTRNTVKHLVPTLTYEMTQQIPDTHGPVCTTISANPLIFSSPLELQINSMLLQPLNSLSELPPQKHMLIIIDGLDECVDINMQQVVIRSFISALLSQTTERISHKVLVVSRPESHIASTFSDAHLLPNVRVLALNTWETEVDIDIFLRAKLDEIKNTHPLRHYLPGIWPQGDSLRRLQQLSVGNFAYASASLRHLASHTNNPERALQDLLSLQPTRAAVAFADLDTLYRHILLSLDAETLFILQKALCLHVYFACRDLMTIAAGLKEERSIIELVFIRTSSLLHIYDSNRCVRFHHNSFGEFLRDKERSGNLYIFSPNVASAVATALSNRWLHPNTDGYILFHRISKSIKDTHLDDMNGHLLSTLVETKIPHSFFTFDARTPEWAVECVADFIQAIHSRSAQDLHCAIGHLYNQAFNLVCGWLRSQFDLIFAAHPTANEILELIMRPWEKQGRGVHSLSLEISIRLARQDRHSFYTILRIFPEMNSLDMSCAILERYVALPLRKRHVDMDVWVRHTGVFTLTNLYSMSLSHDGPMIPEFCRILEKIVWAGRIAFGVMQSQFVTPKDCILRFFYGDGCHVDSTNQVIAGSLKASDIPNYSGVWSLERVCSSLAIDTDRYIRQTHMEQDIDYISADVEGLYRKFNCGPIGGPTYQPQTT